MTAIGEGAWRKYLTINKDEIAHLNDLLELAADNCGTPYALLTLNENNNPDIIVKHGLKTGLEQKYLQLCQFPFFQDVSIEILDAERDSQFSNVPLLPNQNPLRYFVAYPLLSEEGHVLGAMLFLGDEPGQLKDTQKKVLKIISRQIVILLELNFSRAFIVKQKNEIERIGAEKENLSGNNQVLSLILDHVPHPIFLKDQVGKYLLVNKAQSALFGISPQELLDRDDSHFIKNITEYNAVIESDHNLLTSANQIVLPEQEITLPDGSKKILHTTKVPLVNPNGETSILGVSVDLTAFKQMEQAKANIEEAHKKLVDLSPDAIFIHDQENILFVNPSGLKLLHAADHHEVVGKNILTFIPDNYKNSFRQIISLASDKVAVADQVFIALNGMLVSAEVVSATFIHEQRPLKQIIVRDITQKKKFQEDLFKSKEEFKTLAENSTDYICRVNTSLQYLYINKPITKEKFPVNYYLGKTPWEVGYPEIICRMMENNMKEVLETSKTVSTYFEYPGVEGQEFQYNYMTSVPEYDLGGNIIATLITVRDITALKLNEIKLQQTNKELDRFVYSASHELRAPLKSILGLTQIAINDFNTNNHQFQEHYLKSIGGSILRLDKLVNDIIDYSRNSRLDLDVEKIEFRDLIQHILADLRYLKDVHVETNISIKEEFPLYSDRSRLSIVLSNILSNVFKYADKTKKNSRLSIKIEILKSNCIMEIEDNGIGIAEEHLDKICHMFFRAITGGESAGLGMYIVKETMDKLKGKLEIYSTLHEGTLFRINLPNQDPD